VSRWGPSVDGALATVAIITAGVLTLSVVTIQKSGNDGTNGGPTNAAAADPGVSTDQMTPADTQAAAAGGPVTTTVKTADSGGAGNTGQAGQPAALPAARPGLECRAGANGGATDRGVSDNSITLGATVVQTGIGASFLGQVRLGMDAVKDQVNESGGICGRMLNLKLIDDGWDAQRGQQYIENLVQDNKVFALAVNPSSEGLRLASQAGYFAKTQTPVVGTDGMLNSQYTDPWIWPVAASTVSSMHIMAMDAWKRQDLHRFGIVFDTLYHFGVEGAYAFNAAYKRLSGHDIPGYYNPESGTGRGCSDRFCGIVAGQADYSTANKAFNDACFDSDEQGGTCQFVALLMEPNEALGFLRNGFSQVPSIGMAQPLFTTQFASNCGDVCNNGMVWTGYNPPIEQFKALPAVQAYVNGVLKEDTGADTLNQFTEGGYAGMQMLVDGLRKVGPDLTRARLKAVLDSTKFAGGLTTPLTWRPGNHYANTSMRGFAIQYKGNFNGFRSVTDWVHDPWVGQDTGG